jgi:ribonuclease HII
MMLVAGVDEAGRGPLAGPVVAAAVVFQPGRRRPAVADSKTLSAAVRARAALAIRRSAMAWSVAAVGPAEIDRLNIHHATLLAMRRAVLALRVRPQRAVVDGRFCPDLPMPAVALVGGDARDSAVSAASILAKTYRDYLMVRLDGLYPGYGFARHKGYPTPEHLDAIRRLGVVAVHRRTFAPVREALASHPGVAALGVG